LVNAGTARNRGIHCRHSTGAWPIYGKHSYGVLLTVVVQSRQNRERSPSYPAMASAVARRSSDGHRCASGMLQALMLVQAGDLSLCATCRWYACNTVSAITSPQITIKNGTFPRGTGASNIDSNKAPWPLLVLDHSGPELHAPDPSSELSTEQGLGVHYSIIDKVLYCIKIGIPPAD
jgi:hypothetical protein